MFRHQAGGVLPLSGPHRTDRQQVGDIQRVHQRPAHVAVSVARETAAPGLNRIDRFQTAREAEMLNRLHDEPGAFAQALRIFIEQYDVRRVLSELDVAGAGDAHRRFGIRSHLVGEQIHRTGLRAEDLILPSADLGAPFPPGVVQQSAGFFRIDQQCPRVPAVFNGDRIQIAKKPRRAGSRQSVDGNDVDAFAANARGDAAAEVFGRQEIDQVDGDLWCGNRMIVAGQAAVNVPEQTILRATGTTILLRCLAQALDFEKLAEDILEGLETRLEAVEYQLGGFRAMRVALEHPALDLLFRFNRWQIGEREKVLALVVSAFRGELLSALVVDHTRNWIGKCPGIRIAGRLRANGVALDHPAASQPQHAVQAGAQRGHLGV